MVKFLIKKFDIDEVKDNNDNISDMENIQPSEENSISIDIKIKKSSNKNIKIGKYLFDEETLTRASIVKLSKLGYKVKEITKILKINRKLAWKWFNYDKINAKGFRKSKFTGEEKKFLCDQVEGKVTGKEGPSSRLLHREFYDTFKKTISHSSINNILN